MTDEGKTRFDPLDVPSQLLGSNPKVGIWTRTLGLVPMLLQPDHLTQVDQEGRPAIGTLFALGDDRRLFAMTYPAAQPMTVTSMGLTSLELFHSELQRVGSYSGKQALAIAEMLLPDVLRFDYSSSEGFWNGRRFDDDVLDLLLAVMTNCKIMSDGVAPHMDYRSEFPYLGEPHL